MTSGLWRSVVLLCAAAAAAWLVVTPVDHDTDSNTEQPALPPAGPAPLPEDPVEAVMVEWGNYARDVPLPQMQILFKPGDAVALMNKHGTLSGRVRLWQPGDPVPAGFQVNPHPNDWTAYDRELDTAGADPQWWHKDIHSRGLWDRPPPGFSPSETPRKNTLYEQTIQYLWCYHYRTHLDHDRIYVFRDDALIPPLTTRKLYLCDPEVVALYRKHLAPMALPGGRLDLQPMLAHQFCSFRE